MIKETVNEYRFRDVLMSDENTSRTPGACSALFDYYEQLSEDIGEDIELDRVAIRCEWSEYPSALEYANDHGYKEQLQAVIDSNEDGTIKGPTESDAREWLEERTTVLDVENVDTTANEYRTIASILVAQF